MQPAEAASDPDPRVGAADARSGSGTRPSWLLRVRLALGVSLLGVCLGLSVEWWSAVAYLAGLHGRLGAGLWPALVALWALVLSFLLPLGLWAAWPWLDRAGPGRRWGALLGIGLVLGLASVVTSYISAGITPTAGSERAIPDPELERALNALSDLGPRLPAAPAGWSSLLTAEPVACEGPPSEQPVTLLVTFTDRTTRQPVGACFQAASLDAVMLRLRAALLARAQRGALQLELVSGWQRLARRHAWLDILKLRPGLDGVCHEATCLMPWQLLAHGFFSTHRPLDFIPDLQFGVSPVGLRAAVGAAPGLPVSALVRVTTRSYALDLSGAADSRSEPLTPLVRMRRRDVPRTRQALDRAEKDAEAHVLLAQQADGRFRYTLDPVTGVADTHGFNLARQAGTTLVLCELGRPTAEVRRAIELALSSFEPFARQRGHIVALTSDAQNPVARLGESALPLVSMLGCAARTGLGVSPSLAGLSRLMLRLQRDDGGFAPGIDLETGAVSSGPEPLYAAGQAVMALVLLEHRQQLHPSDALPTYEVVHDAVERAMDYFATRYWSHPLRDFFFLEENWHCLAARAALKVHRHPGYEDFCTDYVRFKSRLILTREGGVDADFDGGFGFGNIIPPHNTGAAGFGEALAAAVALYKAQDQPTSAEEELLDRVMGFLLRQQWSRESCVTCASAAVIGGMSEHTHSPLTRIDFVQHAWAALGHGRRVLGLSSPAD